MSSNKKCYEPQPFPITISEESLQALADKLNKNFDKELFEYCNPETKTKWVRVFCYTMNDDGKVEETVLSDTDTGFSCIESFTFEENFCVK
jgi:hypothetical protein